MELASNIAEESFSTIELSQGTKLGVTQFPQSARRNPKSKRNKIQPPSPPEHLLSLYLFPHKLKVTFNAEGGSYCMISFFSLLISGPYILQALRNRLQPMSDLLGPV